MKSEKIINVNVTKSDWRAVKKLAEEKDRSIRSYVREMIKDAVIEGDRIANIAS